MGILYLKRKSEIDVYGHGFDSYCLDIDNIFESVDFGKAERDYVRKKKFGNGVCITEGNFFGERIIKMSRKFTRETGNIFTQTRLDFFLKWLLSSDEIYLYRVYLSRTERIRVYPVISGSEKLKNFLISDYIEFSFLTETTYFQNITATTGSGTKSSTNLSLSITNPGMNTPVTVTFEPTSSFTILSVKLFENVGVEYSYPFQNGDTIEVNSSDLSLTVNSALVIPQSITGSPFNLFPESNFLTISGTANGDVNYSYYGRFL